MRIKKKINGELLNNSPNGQEKKQMENKARIEPWAKESLEESLYERVKKMPFCAREKVLEKAASYFLRALDDRMYEHYASRLIKLME